MHTHPMPFHTFDAAIRASSVYRSLWCASYRSRRPARQRCSVTTAQLADNPQRHMCLDTARRGQLKLLMAVNAEPSLPKLSKDPWN